MDTKVVLDTIRIETMVLVDLPKERISIGVIPLDYLEAHTKWTIELTDKSVKPLAFFQLLVHLSKMSTVDLALALTGWTVLTVLEGPAEVTSVIGLMEHDLKLIELIISSNTISA